MSVTLSPIGGAAWQFFDNNGDPLSGGKLFTYAAGTTTPQVTYTSISGSTAHTNPIILDSAGRIPGGEIWLDIGVGYKFVTTTSTNVLIGTYDNIPSAVQPPAANDADSIMYEQGYTVTAGGFVTGSTYRIVSIGTTDFTLIGASVNATGVHFIATGAGTGTGTAELSQTVETRLRRYVSVKDFGAVGDGVADDTAAIQAAIDATNCLFFPAGTYNISGPATNTTTAVALKGNLEIFGEGANTVIRQLGNTLNGFSVNPLNGGTPNIADNTKDIYIHDMSFTMELTSFREFQHSINANAVTNLLIERCRFVGWRGDAVYIGSGVGVERHNENVTVQDCFFDGINKNNRNGISIIDCDGALIQNNYFTRCTQPNMPGAIDIEPDPSTYHVVKNITVSKNRFYDIGGDSGVICFAIPGIAYTVMPTGFKVTENYIDTFGTNRGVYFRWNNSGGGVPITESMISMDLTISNNSIRNGRFPVLIGAVKGVNIEGNTFQETDGPLGLYFDQTTDIPMDVSVSNNLFLRCGKSVPFADLNCGMQVGNITRLKINNNSFVDCGRSTGGNGVALFFKAGTSTAVSLVGNVFASPTGITSIGVQVSGAHNFGANLQDSNQFLNSLTNYFPPAVYDAWVPVVTGGSSAGTCTYAVRNADYSRVDGTRMIFSAEIEWTGHTGTGQIYISLPNSVAASEPEFFPVTIVTDAITLGAGAQPVGLIFNTGNRIQLYSLNAGVLTSLSMSAAGKAWISGSYYTDS